jgi:hypothetical protein
MALPPNLPKRGLSLEEAAEYCGVSQKTMGRHGPPPVKIGERSIYDRCVLDRWLDQLSDTVVLQQPCAREDALMEAIYARKDTVRNSPR